MPHRFNESAPPDLHTHIRLTAYLHTTCRKCSGIASFPYHVSGAQRAVQAVFCTRAARLYQSLLALGRRGACYQSVIIKHSPFMKKIILTASLAALMCNGAAAQGAYQFKDPGFDNAGSIIPYEEWHSFEGANTSGLGLLGNTAQNLSPKPSFETGFGGTGKCVKIYSKSILGQKANGNLTTGRINMGSITPSSSSNYNYTNRSGDGKMEFAGRPDAVSFYAKFTSGGSPNGRGQFILHGDVDYKDPEDASQESYKVGIASVLIPASGDWVQYTGAFEYKQDQPAKQYLLASFTTNPTPGGSADDNLWIDEVRFLYYHALTGLKFDGVAIERYSEDTLSYNVPARVYDASKLTYTKIGIGATVESSYDEKTALLTLTVKGNDYSVDNSSVTTYKVQFATSEATTYTNDLLIDLKGTDNTPMGKVLQPDTPIQLIKQSDGSSSFLLKDFNFQGIPVGDIRVDNLTQAPQADGSVQYTGSGVVNVMESPVKVSVDATVKGDQMTAVIDIPNAMNAFNITVTFAPSITLSGEETVGTLPEGRTIVALKRHFYQGWNSLCLPFDVTTDGFGTTVKAQAFTSASADGSQLNFTAATTLEAGKPYLVWFENEQDLSADDATPLYFTSDALKADLTAVTYGNYTFKGNYTAHFDMEGRYGVADENGVQKLKVGNSGSYLYATGAYFTSTSAQAAGAVLNFDMQPTGIGSVEQQQTLDSPVYNLQGQKVSDNSLQGLPKGIYIQGGRKVIVR